MPYRFLYSQKHFLQDILMKSLLISFFMASKCGIWIFFLLLSSTLLEMLKVWFMLLQLHVTLWFMKNLNVEYPQPEIRNFILKLLWNESAIGLLRYDVNQYGWGRVGSHVYYNIRLAFCLRSLSMLYFHTSSSDPCSTSLNVRYHCRTILHCYAVICK